MLRNKDIVAILSSYCNYNMLRRISKSIYYYTRLSGNRIMINGRYTIYYDPNESGNNANKIYMRMIYDGNKYYSISYTSEFGMYISSYTYIYRNIYIRYVSMSHNLEYMNIAKDDINIIIMDDTYIVKYKNVQIAEYEYDAECTLNDILTEYCINREIYLIPITI